jgi:hypothetical protein
MVVSRISNSLSERLHRLGLRALARLLLTAELGMKFHNRLGDLVDVEVL